MEKLQLHYSKKNIPIPSKRNYKLQLMDKIEQVIKRMRWKAFFYINPSRENMQQTYGLKTLNIIEHLPASIEKRLSNNSSDEKIFKEAAIYYEDTLNKAGYINNLVYHTPSTSNQENKNKSRQRNVIWFKPPYSKSVATRIGQSFLHLIDAHFPKTHIFNKIFNRNKVKVSYSSTQNIKGIINNHNMNILHQNNEIKDECNCRNKKYCPLGGKCLSPNIVYQGKINSSQPSYN